MMLIHMVQLRDLSFDGSFFFFLGSVALRHSNYLSTHASGSHARHITLAYS